MSSEIPEAPVIRLRKLSKKYPIYRKPSHKLLELLTLRRKRFHEEFWALRDLDLEVEAGVTLGVVGQNGSGKSTLLQILAGILQPSRGECLVRGKAAALLELGAGFNPEFSGRDNVFMNGAILGFPPEFIERQLESILAFAEIGDFIDQPVKTYSSGMFMRLAFSVAIHVDPDILLVDEALAVGDLVFQHRCTQRMRQLRKQGTTIVFVTHDLEAVTRFCDRAILLDRGRKLEDDTPEKVVLRYRALVFERERRAAGDREALAAPPTEDYLPLVKTIPYIHNRYGEGNAKILGIILLGSGGEVLNTVAANQDVELLVSVEFLHEVKDPIVGFTLRDKLGTDISSSNTSYEEVFLPDAPAGTIYTVAFSWKVPPLRPGSYSLSPAVARGSIWDHKIEDWIDNAYIFDIPDQGLVYGQLRLPARARFTSMRSEELAEAAPGPGPA